ncbi:MAG: response regulator, partial [Parafilimonas sp.]
MICALIIDDEESAANVVKLLLQKYVAEVNEVHTAIGASEGIAAINRYNPHLVFLDVEMPLLNGFQLLEKFPDHSFDIIF